MPRGKVSTIFGRPPRDRVLGRLEMDDIPGRFPEIFGRPDINVLGTVRRDAEKTLKHFVETQERRFGPDMTIFQPVDMVAALMVAARKHGVPIMPGELSWATDLVMPASAINHKYQQMSSHFDAPTAIPLRTYLPRILAGIREYGISIEGNPVDWKVVEDVTERLRQVAVRKNPRLERGRDYDGRVFVVAAMIARTALRHAGVDRKSALGVTSLVTGVSENRMDWWGSIYQVEQYMI